MKLYLIIDAFNRYKDLAQLVSARDVSQPFMTQPQEKNNKNPEISVHKTRLAQIEYVRNYTLLLKNLSKLYLRQLWMRFTSTFSLSNAGKAAKRCTIVRQSSKSLRASINFGYLKFHIYPKNYVQVLILSNKKPTNIFDWK